jgi:anaerobic magnesium-protoporphyrin IX monomethyl ester cyclase
VAFIFINVNHDVGFESSESIPISLGYVLASLKSQGSEGIILDDLQDRPLTLTALEKWIHRTDPSAIGFTAYQSTMHRIRFLCRYIKSRHRGIHVILGGAQASPMPSQALEELADVDVLVRGDGEVVIPALARAIARGDTLDKVDGIACRCNGRLVETGRGPEPPADLDTYPSPYLSGVLNLEGKTTAILLSSRGCEHVCRFCITPGLCRGKIRYHSIERVVAEMDLLANQGIERFWFADPNFTADRERTELLLEEKMKRGIATPFWCQTRSDLVDAELLKKLRQAGADTIAFGLESGSPGVLDQTKKGIELRQLGSNIATAQSLEMDTELFSIFGLPGETVENARETLEFVRSLGIPIQSNSGSQQMQLYFGSVYEKMPERFGIKPQSRYRPAYLSVGEGYETSTLSRDEIRKVRNMWALANEQLERDVYYKQRTFEVLDFLLSNREDLEQETAYHAYGALAAAAIEEYDLLKEFLEGFSLLQEDEGSSVEELIGSLGFFVETAEPAGPTDRVIFDSRSWIEGVPFTGISGKYWDVLLGRELLLPSFEEGLISSRQGEETRFTFEFPDDYFQEELRDKEVEVHAKIHKVFRSVHPSTLEEVKKLSIRNQYAFPDLDLLREQNEILYYLALRDADPQELLKTPSHFLTLVHKLAKLGKRPEVSRLGALLGGKPTALNAFADTLVGSGKCEWALEFYQSISDSLPSSVLKRVKCLLSMEQPERAMKLLETTPETPDLEYQETLLGSLKAVMPDSSRIPSLDHNVLNLRVKVALAREMVLRAGASSMPPIVHGLTPHDGGEE